MLPSVLGVDGYNPSIIQYDVPATGSAAPAGAAASAPAPAAVAPASVPAKRVNEGSVSPTPVAAAKVPPTKKATTASTAAPSAQSPAERIDSAIQTLLRYRTGGDGGAALKLLLTFVRNVAENPTELK